MPVTASVVVAIVYILSVFSSVSSAQTSPLPKQSTTRTSSSQTTATAAARKNPKRGLAYASEEPSDILNINQTASVISWDYDWANLPPAYLATANIKYIPMQWGSSSVDKFVDAVRAQGADTILAFNEPDYVSQANMDPTEAARLWMLYIEPLKRYGVRLGGPAVTASGTGRPWLQKFFAACTKCTIDFLPVHWYGMGTSGFYDYLWSIRGDFPNIPVWVTEYADTSTNDTEVLNFMADTMKYLDELEWVEKYAWFGFFRPRTGVHYNMLREDGGLNALGELYSGAKTVHTHIIRNTAFAGYQTLNGADNPNQALVTSWVAYPASGASRRWEIHGTTASAPLLIGLALIVIESLASGVSWTIG